MFHKNNNIPEIRFIRFIEDLAMATGYMSQVKLIEGLATALGFLCSKVLFFFMSGNTKNEISIFCYKYNLT